MSQNAFALLAEWKRNAKNEGMDREMIEWVIEQAQSGDYDNLVKVLADNPTHQIF